MATVLFAHNGDVVFQIENRLVSIWFEGGIVLTQLVDEPSESTVEMCSMLEAREQALELAMEGAEILRSAVPNIDWTKVPGWESVE
jgi:hypothetical protein